ncbi:glycosyltransferase family A protein [Geobacter pickeringii]|uniref:glycosyltransferase family A protein n=1 Tax=Geobacter pickeringii TaxID=345632 RepID=UPI00068BF4B1|nr:glycosyltransferase family A protein [Geobacter pickeringii]
MRTAILQGLYKLFPFDLHGDCPVSPARGGIRISCIINFYGRLNVLEGILWSLVQQDFPRENFEVILIEDRGGTPEGRILAERFAAFLPIVYAPLDRQYGLMGYSRNFGLARSRGEIVLFLDDDTVLLQPEFLKVLDSIFAANGSADAVVPHGHASYACLEDRFDYHDPWFMTSRCTAYRREVLQELNGFMSHFVGQEDVEFVTRFTIAGKRSLETDDLDYYHPPLLVPNTRKPRAVGFSFFGLKGRYSWPVWLLLLANCARHAPLILLPARRFKEQGRFGVGFLSGVLDGVRGNKEQLYG